MNVSEAQTDIDFVETGCLCNVCKLRRWARAWKKLARHGDDATDYFLEEIDKQHQRIQALEEALRPLVENFHDQGHSDGVRVGQHLKVGDLRRAQKLLLPETPA